MKTKNLFFFTITPISVLFTLFITSSLWSAPAPLIPDSGPIVYLLKPILVALVYVLGISVIALLISDGIFVPFHKRNAQIAARFSLALSGVSFAAAVFTLTQALSQPIALVAKIDVIATYGWDVSSVRALLLISLIALISALVLLKPNLDRVGLVAAFNVIGLSLPGLLSHGGGVSTHQWAVVSGLIHGLSIALWISGVAAIFLIVSTSQFSQDQKSLALHKFGFLAGTAVVSLVISGAINAFTRFNSFSELFTSTYGQLVIFKIILLFSALIIALNIRKRLQTDIKKLVGLEVGLLLFTLGVSVVLASTAYPKTGTAAFTLIESVTGFAEPIAFDWGYALTTFAIEPFTFTVGLIALSLYIYGVFRLKKRGDSWPISRSLAWIAAVLLGMYVTNSMLGRYAILMFSAHMTVHMVLAMMVPILLPLGAPLTLILRVLTPNETVKNQDSHVRNIRDWIVALMNSKYLHTLSHPVIAFFLFAGGTWALYFSPLLTVLMRSHLGHLFMDAHFVLAGYLFFWNILGIDPSPRKLPDVLRLGLVFAAAVFHGIFGFITFSSDTQLGGGWFGEIKPSWLTNQIADQQLGGGIAWGFGELPTIFVLAILVYQWASRDERLAKRVTDKEIDDYNDYLKSLNK
jgi:putative copper resistance protein D